MRTLQETGGRSFLRIPLVGRLSAKLLQALQEMTFRLAIDDQLGGVR